MKWRYTLTICVVMLAGCTIKVEPLSTKPSTHATAHRKHRTAKAQPHETPTPKPGKSKPLDLEPTSSPTPIIRLTPTVGGISPLSIMEALS